MSDYVGRCIALQSVPFFASGEQCQAEFCLHFWVGMFDLLLAFHRLLFGGKALPFVAALAVLVLIGVLFFNFLLQFTIAVVMIRAGIECAKSILHKAAMRFLHGGGRCIMYVDWEYYKIFYYVAKYQNFTKAARVLGNNQPNITHSMNRLESQLNCVLFIRSNRGVTLTPEGEMLYSPHCFGGGADPGCRGGAERQCHAGARNHQHQRHRDGAQHLSFQKAAGFPYRISRHPAAHLEPLHSPSIAGREERRGRFRHHLHPGRGGTGAEAGGAEILLRGAGGRPDLHRTGQPKPDPKGAEQLPAHLPER